MEGAGIGHQALRPRARFCGEPGCDRFRALLIGLLGPLGQGRDRKPERGAIEGAIGNTRGAEACFVIRGTETQPQAHCRDQRLEAALALQQSFDPAAGADEPVQEIGEILLVHLAADDGQRVGQRRVFFAGGLEHAIARLGQELLAAAIVQQLGMRRDPRLQGKAAQQRLAEGVDGHDAKPARGIEDAGEEGARQLALLIARRTGEQALQRLCQPSLLHGRPECEALGDAVGHLRRRGLGESEAEQPLRRASRQQQAEEPIGEHGRLAGAGRGRDPDAVAGLGRLALEFHRAPQHRLGCQHTRSFRAHNGPTVHSPRRERWS